MELKVIDENIFLENSYAERLFFDYLSELPIVDMHSHLSAEELVSDFHYGNMSEIWLKGDHYKWRLMRSLGLDEELITGEVDDEKKFMTWAKSIPYTLRNPLFHWTHMELKKYFSWDKGILNASNGRDVYKHCNEILQEKGSAAILQESKVEVIYTTNDPLDDLKLHRENTDRENREIEVLPSFRPDRFLHVYNIDEFNEVLNSMEEEQNGSSASFLSMVDFLYQRIDTFHELGSRVSDLALNEFFFSNFTVDEVEAVYRKLRDRKKINTEEIGKYHTALFLMLSQKYAKMGWVMQLHMGTWRNINSRGFMRLGKDSGYDSISNQAQYHNLIFLMNTLNASDSLPKTVLYNANPSDNDLLASLIGSFQQSPHRGKIQLGPAWWFNDHKDGIEKHLDALSNLGLVSTFIGMVTDSRSILSMVRHEYFRRILANLFGKDMEKGLIPQDFALAGKILQDISYYNVKRYLDLGNEENGSPG